MVVYLKKIRDKRWGERLGPEGLEVPELVDLFDKEQVTMFLLKYRRYVNKVKVLAMKHREVAIEPLTMH